jgi:hypothetical protein
MKENNNYSQTVKQYFMQVISISGFGSAIIEAITNRSKVNAALYNMRKELKYYKNAVKQGIYTLEQAQDGIIHSQNYYEFNVVFSYQNGEEYFKFKHSLDKFLTTP